MFVESGGYKLFYNKIGNDLPPLLLFHGYGQTHEAFSSLINFFSSRFTCYSFDLFYHGTSVAPEDVSIDDQQWKAILSEFLRKEHINQFSITSFSLGGKYALSSLLSMPNLVKELIFIAPDGIQTNLWYNLATYPSPLRWFFKSLIHRPQRLFLTLKILKQLRILDRGLEKFVINQMKTLTQRQRVFDTWMGIRKLKVKKRDIQKTIVQYDIPTTIFLGKFDKVVPAKPLIKFSQRIPNCKLVILNCGHNELISCIASHYYNE